MKAVVQRVKRSSVTIDGKMVGEIGQGLMVLLGVSEDDTERECDYLADKIAGLRIFEDGAGKMNRSLLDIQGEMLIVSQFTLCADCRKGRRPSFVRAARPEKAIPLYERLSRRSRRRESAPPPVNLERTCSSPSKMTAPSPSRWIRTRSCRRETALI